jgi:hypothetical protein
MMAKYRNRPVVIEAVQWFPGVVIEGCGEFGLPPDETGDPCLVINNHDGKTTARPGDWIATGADGRRWVIEDDVFHLTHEPVEE